jgi:hypothetical protein
MPTLNWHKREEAVRAATRAPYWLLEPVTELSYGDADSENLLIQGDNLDALKALLPYYAGRFKCIASGRALGRQAGPCQTCHEEGTTSWPPDQEAGGWVRPNKVLEKGRGACKVGPEHGEHRPQRPEAR